MKAKKIFMWIVFAVLVIIGIEWMQSFWWEHSYYQGMLTSWSNRWLIASSLACWVIPLLYMRRKKLSLLSLVVSTWGALSLFMILHEWIQWNLLTLFSAIPLVFNTLVLYILAIAFIFATFSLWEFIWRKLKLFQTIRWQETFLTFWIGLTCFLVIVQILEWIWIFYGYLNRVLLLWLICLWWFERKYLVEYKDSLLSVIENAKDLKTSSNLWWIFSILIVVSFWYYFFNFSHSYIPYSTAWDANHEYMYLPKVVSENNWILWWNVWPASSMLGLWHSYIAFFFSVWTPISYILNIAKDTVAVNLNALSWVFVLLFGLWALSEALVLFKKREDDEETPVPFMIGWTLILMWLTSWMGAFLLFVDNKPDMWVLALSLLAILSWFVFLNYFNKRWTHIEWAQSTKYLVISAILFSFAIIAKVTAFIDAVIFALIMVWFCLNTTTLIWMWIMILWLMWVIQPLFTFAFITKELWLLILAVWAVITIIWLIRGLINRTDAFSKRLKQMVIWWITLVISLFIFKWPWTAIGQLSIWSFNFSTFVKSTLLAKAPQFDEKKLLLAQSTWDIESIEEQASIDEKVFEEETNDISFQQCLLEKYDKEDLDSTMQKAPGNSLSEDVWRYVWFWWREFKKTRIGWGVLKLLFRKNDACYWWDSDWRILCKNAELIEKEDVNGLKKLAEESLDKDWQAYQLIADLVEWKTSWDDLRDYYTSIETYYKEHSIKTTDSSVYIPYRYIVPLNVVFNWSLQNHSSYYTDIGLIWLAVFAIMLLGLIYAICTYDKKRKQLLIIWFSTIIGWVIWWAIAWGIVWYGLGLIIWSSFVVAVFFQEWKIEKDWNLRIWVWGVLALFALWMLMQWVLNASRIASQSSSWPFGWYKSNVGERQEITKDLEFKNSKVYNFNSEDVFWLQFWQYQPFLNAVKWRNDKDWILIAWTYIQYFLDNRNNIISDGMLTHLWQQVSDFNSCRGYQRLKNENVKYLIIDPNIWTVGRAGEWNESLFYRFFARLSEDEQEIQTHGAITMLVKMAQEWYLDLLYTNNIGAKYAFELSDAELISHFWAKSKDDLILLRAKMAVIKFFYSENEILEKIFMLFQERILNGQWVSDIASMIGKDVDVQKLLPVIKALIEKWDTSWVKNLTQDEKYVVSQYAGIYRLMRTPAQKEQAQNVLTQLFQNSVFGSSQVISLELK